MGSSAELSNLGSDHRDDRSSRLPILMVAPQPCFEERGTPLNVLQMCRALGELGYQVHLITYLYGKGAKVPGLRHRKIGRWYHRLNERVARASIPIGFSYDKLLLDGFLGLKMLRLLSHERYLAIHAIEEAVFLAAPLAWMFRTPLIADLDSDMCDQLANSSSKLARALVGGAGLLRRFALRRAWCAVTVCGALSELVREIAPQTRIFQIEDTPLPGMDRPADPERLESLRTEFGLRGRRVILYTGNFEPYQGVDALIESMPAVAARHPDAVLVLVGGSPVETHRLSERAKALGAGRHVVLCGRQPVDSMPEFMELAEVLASPRQEGNHTPLKIYSYMLAGKPIVATDRATHTQVLSAKTAILVPAGPKGMAQGMNLALEDPDSAARLGSEARETVLRDYSYETFKRKLGEAYRSIPGAAGTVVSLPSQGEGTHSGNRPADPSSLSDGRPATRGRRAEMTPCDDADPRPTRWSPSTTEPSGSQGDPRLSRFLE
jgi:glycosyltransferase involved in cell wall biosynthesis